MKKQGHLIYTPGQKNGRKNNMSLPVFHAKTAYWFIGNGCAFEQEHEPTPEEIEKAKQNRVGVYYVVNNLGENRNEKRHLKHNKNVASFTASFVDLDERSKPEQWEDIHTSPIPFSAIVESGRGYHGYFVYEEPEPNTRLIEWVACQHAIAKRFKGDHACSDGARVLRLPGSWHVKDGFEPSLVQTVETTGFVYSLDEIIEAFDVTPPALYPEPSVFVLRSEIHRIPIESIQTNFRHDRLVKQASSYLSRTPSTQFMERKARLKVWYFHSCVPPKDDWEAEVDSVCRWIALQEFGFEPLV